MCFFPISSSSFISHLSLSNLSQSLISLVNQLKYLTSRLVCLVCLVCLSLCLSPPLVDMSHNSSLSLSYLVIFLSYLVSLSSSSLSLRQQGSHQPLARVTRPRAAPAPPLHPATAPPRAGLPTPGAPHRITRKRT